MCVNMVNTAAKPRKLTLPFFPVIDIAIHTSMTIGSSVVGETDGHRENSLRQVAD